MKTKTKLVTVEQEIYIAEDGKEFDDQDDCLSHERDLREETLEFYDYNFMPSNLENCTYVKTVTQEDVNNLLYLCHIDGISHDGITDKPGIYMYMLHPDEWVNITEAVAIIYGGNADAN